MEEDRETKKTEKIEKHEEDLTPRDINDKVLDKIEDKLENISNKEKEEIENEDNKTEEKIKDKSRDESKRKKSKIKKTAIVIVAIVLVMLICSTIFAILNLGNEKIISGVKIQGIDVSNIEKDNVKQKLKEIAQKAAEKQIILKYGELEVGLDLRELNINYNVDQAVEEAYSIGRVGNIFRNNFDIIKTKLFLENIKIDINYDDKALNDKITSIGNTLPGATQEYSYFIENEELIITKGNAGIVIDKEKLNNDIKEEIYKLNKEVAIINIPVINKEPDEIDIEKIHEEIYKKPEDAYITKDPLTVHPNVNGVDFAISIEEAKEILKKDKEEYTIPLKITIADKTISDLGEEAFPNTLGTFTTIYDASNKNRSNNIVLATQKINGTVILPGETFSYNQIVGKRTIAAGFKEAGAYAGGQVIQDVGGGICQVSSTLYNAVLYANLEIVDRSNHYFQTSYVDAGRDATVSWGGPDFKFKNNRTYPIKIEASAKNGVSKITIKGIKEEKEYEVVIQSKVTSIVQKNVKYEENNSLEDTVEQVKQEGHNGCTSKAYKILRLNGVTVSTELLSSDYYHALDKIIIKGTKKVETNENDEHEKENVVSDDKNENIGENPEEDEGVLDNDN